MDAKTFLEQYGKAEAERICKLAGTSYAYFTQLATGNRRPSADLALKLEHASNERLSFEALLRHPKKNPRIGRDAIHPCHPQGDDTAGGQATGRETV
jgi:transcriptional regulator with XRE-family HTH domain